MSQEYSTQQFIELYGDIIKEELNIKEIWWFEEKIKAVKIYKPLWKYLSQYFGKDTARIIAAAKQWSCRLLEDKSLLVFDGDKEWVLNSDWYEIEYQWISDSTFAFEDDIIVQLDVHIDEQLKKEWTIREISRLCNQLRKDAGYHVSDKVALLIQSDNMWLEQLLFDFSWYLEQEALIHTIKKDTQTVADIQSEFSDEELWSIRLWLKR
jgi:isoleucyl-tRNA synthetase